MKKFRGKKRYFRNLEKEASLEAHDLDFSDASWFDFWHTHLDFYGRGNESVRCGAESFIFKRHIIS